jgi:hypothetical protein
MVLEVLSPGVKRGRGVTLTTHSHLVPRLRMSRSIHPLPPCASMACNGTALFCFYFFITEKAKKKEFHKLYQEERKADSEVYTKHRKPCIKISKLKKSLYKYETYLK